MSQLDYAELLAILRVNDFTAYQNQNFIYIIPLKQARSSAVPILDNAKQYPADQYVSGIISMEKMCGYTLIPALRPAVPQHGHLSVAPGGRLLYITDSYSNVMRIQQIVKILEEKETSVQPCEARSFKKRKGKKDKKIALAKP